jgi:hypothetical protein
MKNYARKDHPSKERNADIEQQIPMSLEDYQQQQQQRINRNNYVNNRPSVPVTQPPSRGYTDINKLKMNSNPQIDQTPIYVPPFLINNNNSRANRHNNHNAPLDYLPWSVANIFICVIIALPALFFSVQTRDMKKIGNIKKAKVNSRRSLVLNIIASIIGLTTILAAIILRFALYQLFVNNDVKSQNVPLMAG